MTLFYDPEVSERPSFLHIPVDKMYSPTLMPARGKPVEPRETEFDRRMMEAIAGMEPPYRKTEQSDAGQTQQQSKPSWPNWFKL